MGDGGEYAAKRSACACSGKSGLKAKGRPLFICRGFAGAEYSDFIWADGL